MSTTSFLQSSSARFFALAFGVAIGGAGVAGFLEEPLATPLGSTAMILGMAIAVFALASAIEDHMGAAALAAIGLPWATFLFELGRHLVPRQAGYGFLIVALASLAFAARPGAQKAGLSLHQAEAR